MRGWFDWLWHTLDGLELATPPGYCALFCKIAIIPWSRRVCLVGPGGSPRSSSWTLLNSSREAGRGGEPSWAATPLHLTRYGVWMSSEWEDRDKARRFALHFPAPIRYPAMASLLADPDASEGAREGRAGS